MRARYQSEWVKKNWRGKKGKKNLFEQARDSLNIQRNPYISFVFDKQNKKGRRRRRRRRRKKETLSAIWRSRTGMWCILLSAFETFRQDREYGVLFFLLLYPFLPHSFVFFFFSRRNVWYEEDGEDEAKKKNLTPFESQEKKLEGKMVICCCCDKMNDLLAARLATIYTEYIANRPKRYTLLLSIVLLELPLWCLNFFFK